MQSQILFRDLGDFFGHAHGFQHGFSQHGRRLGNVDACRCQGFKLGRGRTLTTRHNGTSVTHASTRGRCCSSNKSHDGLIGVTVLLEPFGRLFFGGSSNFSNHNDTFRLGVVGETFQAINKVGTIEWVAANTYTCRLAQTSDGRLPDRLVGEGTRTRNNTNLSRRVNVSRLNV